MKARLMAMHSIYPHLRAQCVGPSEVCTACLRSFRLCWRFDRYRRSRKGRNGLRYRRKEDEVTWSGPTGDHSQESREAAAQPGSLSPMCIPARRLAGSGAGEPEYDAITLTVKGRMMRVPAKFVEIANGTLDEPIDAHSIQPLLHRASGRRMRHGTEASSFPKTRSSSSRKPRQPECCRSFQGSPEGFVGVCLR